MVEKIEDVFSDTGLIALPFLSFPSLLSSFLPNLSFQMSYTIPEMDWPIVTKTKNSVLLSERYGTTNGRWHIPVDEAAATAIRDLLTSYKVPVYHVTVDEFTDMGPMPGHRGRVPYIDSRYIYVWTFSAPNTPVVHVYHQGGDRCDDLTCHYEKTVDAALLTNSIYECRDVIARLKALYEVHC